MLSAFDASTLTIAFCAIAGVAFVFGTVLNAITQENGFGPTGNTVLFAIGFYVAVYVSPSFGVDVRDFKLVVAYGLGGAFALFSLLALLKAGLSRR